MAKEIIYPKHEHPHGINDVPPNESRIWVCEECLHIFTNSEIREDKKGMEIPDAKEMWGHPCKAHPCRKGQRCEAHLEPYMPDIQPVEADFEPEIPDAFMQAELEGKILEEP